MSYTIQPFGGDYTKGLIPEQQRHLDRSYEVGKANLTAFLASIRIGPRAIVSSSDAAVQSLRPRYRRVLNLFGRGSIVKPPLPTLPEPNISAAQKALSLLTA